MKRVFYGVYLTAIVLTIIIHGLISQLYCGYVQRNTDLILARYHESLDYLNNKHFKNFRTIYIYNKGDILLESKLPKNSIVIPLENVGREGHSYLYHIIHQHNNLADHNIFLPASFESHPLKKQAVQYLFKNYPFSSYCFFGENFKKPIVEASFDFTIEHYACTNTENFHFNNDIKLKPADIRPYGLWLKNFFPNNNQNFQSACGIFAVNKQLILDNKMELYIALFKELNDHHNPEAGHYMERSWAALFNNQNKLEYAQLNNKTMV